MQAIVQVAKQQSTEQAAIEFTLASIRMMDNNIMLHACSVLCLSSSLVNQQAKHVTLLLAHKLPCVDLCTLSCHLSSRCWDCK